MSAVEPYLTALDGKETKLVADRMSSHLRLWVATWGRGTCWTVVLVGNCRVPIGSPEVAVEFAVVASRTRANIGTVWGYMAAVTKVVPRQLNFVKT